MTGGTRLLRRAPIARARASAFAAVKRIQVDGVGAEVVTREAPGTHEDQADQGPTRHLGKRAAADPPMGLTGVGRAGPRL